MENTSSYVTNTFFLRYAHEEIKIDEFCQFTCEFALTKDFKAPDFYLKAELMHAGIKNQTSETSEKVRFFLARKTKT